MKKKNKRKENMTKKTYQFDVPCIYYYEINADTEEQAKKILEDKGGIEIEGELCLESENYKEAKLVGVLQPQTNERNE